MHHLGVLKHQVIYCVRRVISPVLANMTLDGLETAVKTSVPKNAKVNVIRYADDCVPRMRERRFDYVVAENH